MKISDHLPDQYVIAARGYTAEEAEAINKEYGAVHCEVKVNREAVLFNDAKVVRDVEKQEAKYLKSMFKK